MDCEHCKQTVRCNEEKEKMVTRLKKIEGQVRGIEKMVENDRYCIDIINQVSAIEASLRSFSRSLLERHIKTCVQTDALSGNTEKLDELCAMLKNLMR